MTNEEERSLVKFLRNLKSGDKSYADFDERVTALQRYAATTGLENENVDLLVDVITNVDLSATRLSSLVKCLTPKYKLPENSVKRVISWCLSSLDKLPVTASTIVIQWIIGLWDYQLVDRKIINMYYPVWFRAMLNTDRLEKHVTRLIYMLAKPDDIRRRDVTALLGLQQKYSRPRLHVVALLSLFKSYKPELVPERIQSVNIESVWKSIPEVLRLSLQSARDRLQIQRPENLNVQRFDWSTSQVAKSSRATKTSLLPSIGYFQIGSSIFKEKDTKSIFEITSVEELGKFHLCIEVPCNAVSLLANMAGYHLLTYADYHYQSRFSYNLYNTLRRAFIVETENFSAEESGKLLDMTIEFSRYMQQGIPVAHLFLYEYLYFNTGEHVTKLLGLLEWMIMVSVTDLQEKLIVHVECMYYESTLNVKCEIIKSLRTLIRNLFVNQAFDECRRDGGALFLRQSPTENVEDVIAVLTDFSSNLIVRGLQIHNFDALLISEALSFYEEIVLLESHSNTLSLTLAPPAVIYGGFVTRTGALLSRVCKLLLRYREISVRLKESALRDKFQNRLRIIAKYAEDIITALWHEKALSNNDEYYCFNLPETVKENFKDLNFDSLSNITNNYALLPCKCTLTRAGLKIVTKEDALSLALHYYPAVGQLIALFQS